MNRLLTKKKAKDDVVPDDTLVQTSTIPKTSSHASKPSQSHKKKGWRRRKEKQEPEPELDITTALPSADSFRTSLIMSGLSTRFSMLREQDDPFSLLGKASDDSVLLPKRRSRLGDFGYTAGSLGDIAEVSSLSSHVRPPFGAHRNFSYGDTGSATDDDASMNGSIMTRARPGEGNMLFGGRQKIYRIPIGDAGSVNNLGSSDDSRGMKGRALYEDDVSTSAFQRLREEQKARERAELEREAELDEMRKDSLSAPSFTYNERRETVSSTNSGPSMVSQSTAATSVANSVPASSPGLPSSSTTPAVERTKSRRLYEQGLDQHMLEQQNAAITRLTSVKRNTSIRSGNSAPYRSRSAGNLRDRLDAGGARVDSPMLATEQLPLPGCTNDPPRESTPPSSRPLSPESTNTERDRALFNALDPRSRGMATATGHFNKPQQFSEEQFLQRQMSLLQQQREKKTPSLPRSAGSSTKDSCPPDSNTYSPVLSSRSRTGTNRTDRSWSNASTTNEGSSSMGSGKPSSIDEEQEPLPPQPAPEISGGTFLAPADNDDSDYESADQTPVDNQPVDESRSIPPPPPPDTNHPAMRSATAPVLASKRLKRNAWSPEALKSGLEAAGESPIDYFENKQSVEMMRANAKEGESPDTDLKGLVREHLRHPSNSSSIYPAPRTPGHYHEEFDLRVPSMYSTENPWENDDFQHPPLPARREEGFSAQDEVSKGPQGFEEVPAPTPDWEQEMKQHHIRGASTETAYERKAFDDELAQRQRTIQENLRVKVENGNKHPGHSQKNVFESSLKPFGMLKPKSSREEIPKPREQPRPSFQGNAGGNNHNGSNSNESSRSSSRQRRAPKDVRPSPPPMGRTLHSKLPRHHEDADVDSRPVRPSVDQARPMIPPRNRAMTQQTTPPESGRTSSSRDRSGSEQSQELYRDRKTSNPLPRTRPSLDTRSARRDSGNGRSPMSAPAIESTDLNSNRLPRQQNFVPAASSQRESPIDGKPHFSSGYSANSTPPLSAVSSPNLTSTATSPSMLSQASPGAREMTPSTGFFFPPTQTDLKKSLPPPPPSSAPQNGGTVRGRGRKPTISKADISEPTLIASTSAVTTVDLPPGASLQNGLRDDFDVVLMGRDPSGPAPPPHVPTGETLKAKKSGFFKFNRRDNMDKDQMLGMGLGLGLGDEPEPRRFRIQRLETGEGRVGHRTLRTGDSEDNITASTIIF